MKLSLHGKGLLMCVLATVWISPDALIMVWVGNTESGGTVIFWKYLFASLVAWTASAICLGGPRQVAQHICETGRYFVLGVLIMASCNALLSLAFMSTSSANALLLFSLHTVWASLGGCLFLRDKLPLRTFAMVLVGVGSAVAVFAGGGHGDGESGEGSIGGDLMATGAGVGFASLMLLCRYLGKERPGVSTLPFAAGGCTLAMLIGLGLAVGDVALTRWWPGAMLLFVDGGLCIGLASPLPCCRAPTNHLL